MTPFRSRAEKRSNRRVPLELTAHCRIGNRFIREPLGDLSESGLFLRTREPAKPGAQVRVALALPYAQGPKFCTLVGSVVRLERDDRGMPRGLGVSFVPALISRYDRDLLTGFLQQTP